MRLLLCLTFSLLLIGCNATPKKSTIQFSPPSIAKVAAPLKSAKTSSVRLKEVVALQPVEQTKIDLSGIIASIAEAERFSEELDREIKSQTESLNLATAEKNRALESANYWQEKHQKALRELWAWRIAGLTLAGLLLGYVGLRVGGKIAL